MVATFSISPRILSHLGEDLIKNESIALLELVKNSYDACASNCHIDFHFENDQLSYLLIQDDGLGMNKKIIEDVWMVIGTDNKLKKIEPNECGRVPLGEKGIGRLGVHKLGHKIYLTSKAKNSKEVCVTIDWGKLINAKRVEDFTIEIYENDTPKIFKSGTGTQIRIEKLKTSWDRRELREVYRNLNSLNSPFSNKNESFKVNVTTNSYLFEGLPDFEDIKASALYFGHCVMKGSMIEEFDYEFKPWQSLFKIDKGRNKKTNDLIPQERIIIDEDGKEINLDKFGIGPIIFDLIIFELSSHIFSFVNTEKTSIKNYLRDNGGVRVYRDGVRVYDYGESDNDWLGLEQKRISRFAGKISNNMVIGSANISRAESLILKEKSNREGFIQNESFYAFKSAVNYALNLIVRERNVDREILNGLYKQQRTIEPVLSDLNELIGFVNEKVSEPQIKDEILKYLYRINSQYDEVRDVLIKSANAGLNLGVVIHEVEKLISSLLGSVERNDKEKSLILSQRLEKIVKGYSAMIKKSEIRLTLLSTPVKTTLSNFEFRFIDHKIEVITNHQSSNLEAFLAESETISVITNILDNSIYWLKFARKENRKISIFLTDQIKIGSQFYNSIVISDNGPGFNIPTEIAIKPFITGKPHNVGSGLGLHVASEMMKAMKGQLLFLDKYEIDLPETAKKNNVDMAIVALCFPLKK